jgi:predicted Zn finger-like uncharacterized protein
MILTCPQCATRYQVDGAKFPAAGRNVRCAKCGNLWHQLGPVPEPETERMVEESSPAQRPEPVSAPAPAYEPAPVQPRVAAFVPPATRDVVAESAELASPTRSRTSWLGRVALGAGWLLLAGLVLAIGWAAVNFRDSVAVWVPKTSSFYAAVGLKVNTRGMDLTDVTYRKRTEGGQSVLTVTGRIVNNSTHELTVPPVRVVLFDVDKRKLVAESFVASVLTLKSGGVSNFHARIASPPPDMNSLQVSFVRAGE